VFLLPVGRRRMRGQLIFPLTLTLSFREREYLNIGSFYV